MFAQYSVLSFSLLSLFSQSVFAVDNLVDVGYAKYRGQHLPSGVSQWLGIRYAAPPLGGLRFEPPHEPNKVDDVQEAIEVSPRMNMIMINHLLELITLQLARCPLFNNAR